MSEMNTLATAKHIKTPAKRSHKKPAPPVTENRFEKQQHQTHQTHKKGLAKQDKNKTMRTTAVYENSRKPIAAREKTPNTHTAREKTPNNTHTAREKTPNTHDERPTTFHGKSPKHTNNSPTAAREQTPNTHDEREKTPEKQTDERHINFMTARAGPTSLFVDRMSILDPWYSLRTPFWEDDMSIRPSCSCESSSGTSSIYTKSSQDGEHYEEHRASSNRDTMPINSRFTVDKKLGDSRYRVRSQTSDGVDTSIMLDRDDVDGAFKKWSSSTDKRVSRFKTEEVDNKHNKHEAEETEETEEAEEENKDIKHNKHNKHNKRNKHNKHEAEETEETEETEEDTKDTKDTTEEKEDRHYKTETRNDARTKAHTTRRSLSRKHPEHSM